MQNFNTNVSTVKMLRWSGLSNSNYYYKKSNNKPGKRPDTTTLRSDGQIVDNSQIIKEIEGILSIEFLCYGYVPVTDELADRGYVINHKKVYRIMHENKLLCGKKIVCHTGKRTFVKYRRIKASYPLEYLCMDIKYIYIHGEKRYAYLLSLIDVYSRRILNYVFKTSIKKHDVIWLLQQVLADGHPVSITVRNDNGSQFIANSVREYLKSINVNQEFTHVATPEENAYIEAFHSIMERELIARYEFDSFHHADLKIAQYIFTYNYIRKHGKIGLQTPVQKWNEYISSLSSDKQQIDDKPKVWARLFEEKISNTNSSYPIFSSNIHFNLDQFVGAAKFAYLMVNDNIRNFIMFNSQTNFNFLSKK